MRRVSRPRAAGFTLMELLVTLALLALLATLVVPLAQVQVQRQKEQALRQALREIRVAIDDYKRAADMGRIASTVGMTGYPPSLRVLVDGVPDQRDPKKRKIYFLRRIPADPLHTEPAAAAPEDTWGLRAYASEPDEPEAGDDVYDVFSRAEGTGLNGVAYASW